MATADPSQVQVKLIAAGDNFTMAVTEEGNLGFFAQWGPSFGLNLGSRLGNYLVAIDGYCLSNLNM